MSGPRDGMLRGFFRSDAEPTRMQRLFLGSTLFVLLTAAYLVASRLGDGELHERRCVDVPRHRVSARRRVRRRGHGMR